MSILAGSVKAVSLPAREAECAREASAALAEFADAASERLTIQVREERTGRQMEATVPAGALRVLADALDQFAKGQPVTLVPLDAELTPQQVADLMGVSPRYVVKLLDEGKLPFRVAGEQRRIEYRALVRYLEEYRRGAEAALAEMTAEAQRLGLYDDPVVPAKRR